MDKKTTSALILSAALAGAGIGRATSPAPPAPTLERVCVDVDGSAQVYTSERKQLLVPPDHALAVMHREGGKVVDVVPPGMSKAIRALVDEAGKVAAQSGAK